MDKKSNSSARSFGDSSLGSSLGSGLGSGLGSARLDGADLGLTLGSTEDAVLRQLKNPIAEMVQAFQAARRVRIGQKSLAVVTEITAAREKAITEVSKEQTALHGKMQASSDAVKTYKSLAASYTDLETRAATLKRNRETYDNESRRGLAAAAKVPRAKPALTCAARTPCI